MRLDTAKLSAPHPKGRWFVSAMPTPVGPDQKGTKWRQKRKGSKGKKSKMTEPPSSASSEKRTKTKVMWRSKSTRHWTNADLMPAQRRPALNQHWSNVSCLLGPKMYRRTKCRSYNVDASLDQRCIKPITTCFWVGDIPRNRDAFEGGLMMAQYCFHWPSIKPSLINRYILSLVAQSSVFYIPI